MTDTPAPSPIVFVPELKEKVWGGRRLARLGKALPEVIDIGESWELADLDATSASGGGGGASRSVIASGPLEGKTIHDAMDLWGADLLGAAKPSQSGGFPLLVKYLDAREHLSVQVHPSAQYAESNPGAHLKTESWIVLAADEHAVIYKGLKDGVTEHDLRDAIERGTVPELLVAVPAAAGDCHTLPSGTLHALGAGVLVAEIQTPSDTTFRVYDWAAEYGRQGREMHIDAAIACADLAPAPPAARGPEPPRGAHGAVSRVRSASTEYYSIDTVLASCAEVPLTDSNDAPVVVMTPRTAGASLASRTDAYPELELTMGQTALVPAARASDTVLRAGPDTLAIIARVSG